MPRVLIIEDDRDLRDILGTALAEAGYEVRTAIGGLEGLRLAREQVPDLVLLDLMLPDIGGTSVCRQLKYDDATSSARVIIVSAKGDEVDRVVGFELGADDYVVKPFSVDFA
jgi:two-component system phosphate regulon response regulator PhoB